jgi:uncharacterized protein YbdZ (MbtH family)
MGHSIGNIHFTMLREDEESFSRDKLWVVQGRLLDNDLETPRVRRPPTTRRPFYFSAVQSRSSDRRLAILASRLATLIFSVRRSAGRPSGWRRCHRPCLATRQGRSSRPHLRHQWQPLRPRAEQQRSRRRDFPRPTQRPCLAALYCPAPARCPAASQARSRRP